MGSTISLLLCFLTLSRFPYSVQCTSVKMDFLPLGDVRTDPIVNPTCLSDHVHTFYGASSIRPETTYDDLRSATENSGNVEENKSLYWHPTVYNYDSSSNTFHKDDIYFASAYYIWETGKVKAFPNGFKMVVGMSEDDNTRANAECVVPSRCEKSDCSTNNDFFPSTACAELEVSMAFPTCWDGVNVDSEDHRSHVAYDLDGGEFGGDCPSSHPIKIPEIQLFFRISPYDGGHHQFSDGTGNFHADYFSGWDEGFLQSVLDNCNNYSEAANPDAFCEDFLTFRGAGDFNTVDCRRGKKDDEDIVSSLQSIQPDPALDVSTITEEAIDGVSSLPRGACSGTLIPAQKQDNSQRREIETGGVGHNHLRNQSTKSEMSVFLNSMKSRLSF